MRYVIIDTDPGVDDALALMLAFNSPELKVEAVTTVAGNVSQEKAHINALKVLEFLGISNVPVARGASKPLLRDVRNTEEFHGKTGLGEAVLPEPGLRSNERSAVDLILEKEEELGKKLTLIAIGPLTNIASSILVKPELAEEVAGLVIMGGAFGVTPYGHGNVTPVAEFNIWHDPEAAKIVFDSGIPVTAVGLDVTTHPDNCLTRDQFEKIESLGTRRARLVADLIRNLVKRFGDFKLHDPMAIAAAIDPSLVKTKKFIVEVETVSPLTLGQTVIDRRPSYSTKWRKNPNVDVCLSIDGERFLKMFFDRVVYG